MENKLFCSIFPLSLSMFLREQRICKNSEVFLSIAGIIGDENFSDFMVSLCSYKDLKILAISFT